MIIERLDRPTAAVIDLAEAKNHVRVDFDDDDAAIARMIDAATREAEELAQLALLTQPIRIILQAWPASPVFTLPISPLVSRESVSITTGTEVIEDFTVLAGARPAVRMDGLRPSGVVLIDYRAGFGPNPSDVPEDLRHALLDQIAAYYGARASGDPKVASLSPHFARIVGRYRGVRL